MPSVISCSSELAENEEMNPANQIYINADIARGLYSRSYIETGPVEDGTFYISYPTTSNSAYNTLPVTFDNPGSSPGIGMVRTEDSNQMFTWNMVGGGATPIFYLDNVAPNPALASDVPNTVMFDSSYNPYCAGLFDRENGTNDLLWGTKTVGRQTTNTVMFDLHHNMSRIRLQITVDKTNEHLPGDLSLEDAIVSISSINQTPVSYNRLDGTLELPSETPTYNPYSELIFVGDEIGWNTEVTDPTNPNITVYTTFDFVVPPQGLLDDENRPRLTITLKNGKVYSGILPHAMLIPDPNKPNDSELSYPVTMYFLKEHILTIRTLISEEPPELAFMPVQVVEWVDKGEFSLEGHQAGLYLPSEFYNMIGYYESYNEYQLTRYGVMVTPEGQDTPMWYFNVFRTMTLSFDQIYQKMPVVGGKLDFQFNFNGYSVFVTRNGVTQQVNQNQLYNIVTGTSIAPFQ